MGEAERPDAVDSFSADPTLRRGKLSERERETASTAAPGPVAARLGRYMILDLLGSGGMGMVYSAFDPQLDRRVAIKVLKVDVGDVGDRQRLLREAKAMAKLTHPNVVTVHDAGEEEGQTYVAMEFVRGSSLRRWLAEARRWDEIVAVFLQAGEGLRAAHEVGLVHRDFKPDNVLMTASGVAKVADFGLARGGEPMSAESVSIGDADTIHASRDILTRDGMLVGTPAYMAPEQFLGAPADARSDQFSFFVTLHEALHGVLPFAGATIPERATNVTSGHRAPRPATTAVPPWIDAVIDRGLRVRREDRWPTMEAALAALTAAQVRKVGRWRRRLAVGVAALGVAGIVGLGLQWALERAIDERRGLCAGADEALVGVWDTERRGRVERAFMATALPYARDAWERVAARLDARAGAWSAMYTEACQATHLRGEQSPMLLDLRMACLQRRRLEVRSLVDVLVDADAGVVEHAVEALAGLADLEDCADTTALLATPSANTSPAAVAIREGLAQARALQVTASYQAALELAAEARSKAEAIAEVSMIAEARLLEGDILGELGEAKAGERLMEAFLLAEESGDVNVNARAALELMHYATSRSDLAAADQWSLHAGALIRRLRAAQRPVYRGLEAWHASLLGTLHAAAGRLEEAESTYRRARDLLAAIPGDKELALAGLYNNLGNVLVRRGDFGGAAVELERSVSTYREVLGPQHPLLGAALNNLGELAIRRRAWESARATYTEARAILVAAHGADHPNVGVVDNNLGTVAMQLGDRPAAAEYFNHAREVFVAAFGPESPPLAYPLTGLGELRLLEGDLAGARELLEEALARRDPGSPTDLAQTRFALARALGAEGRERGLVLAREAREAYAAAMPAFAHELAEVEVWIREQEAGGL